MANKILVARGTKARIEAVKSTLATNELVYATDTGELGVKKADGNIQYFMNASDINALVNALDNSKVDKITGKGLSTNDYTNADKAKVANLPDDTIDELSDIIDELTDRLHKTSDLATQQEAEEGQDVQKWMNPLRVKQAIEAQVGEALDLFDINGKIKVSLLPDTIVNSLEFKGTIGSLEAIAVNGKYFPTHLEKGWIYITSGSFSITNLRTELEIPIGEDYDPLRSAWNGWTFCRYDARYELTTDFLSGDMFIICDIDPTEKVIYFGYVDNNSSDLYVPLTRQINGKSLSSDITLTTADINETSTRRYVTGTEKSKINNLPSNTIEELENKVDKVAGKVLSTNDYTNEDKEKVNNLPSNTIAELENKVDKVTGKGLSTNDYTNADKAKVSNLPSNTIAELNNKVDKVSGKGLSTNDYTDAEKAKLASVETQVQNISSELADLQNQVDNLSQSSGGWTLLYSGATTLSLSSFSSINLSGSISTGDVLAIEVRYGSSSTSYNSKIVLTAIGTSSSADSSSTYPRKIGFTEFDGEYFKNVYFVVYRGTETQLRAGYYSFLRGRFLPSSNTIEWNTNLSLLVYITRIWKVV